MTAPARTVAFAALRSIEDRRVDLPGALAASRARLSDDRDRSLAADIVAGTLRWQAALDHLIAQAAGRPLHRLDPEVLTVLRLSLYQVLHLSRVPASAVVDDAVDLTRAARKPSAAPFVNAVLRTLLRARHRLALPPRPADVTDRRAALDYLATAGSHPFWLVERWLDRHGFDAADAWVQFNNAVPALTLRANRLRGTRDELAEALAGSGVETRHTEWAPDGLIVARGNPLALPADDRFAVQDEASQLVPLAVDAHPGETVLDLCASPGGKTTALAARMEDRGLVVACDVRPRRMRLLRETVRRSGSHAIRLVQVPRSGALPFRRRFARVLVDAPCSGLGTLRREPDLRWRRAPEDLATFAAAQRTILDRAADHVAPGGRLVYATCSSEPEENEQVVEAFLREVSGYRLIDLRHTLPDRLSPLIDASGYLRTLPFRHGLEAFFAAALLREDATD